MRQTNSKTANRLLWTVQGVLALLFLFAGISKLVMPLTAMQQGPIVLPGVLLRFIGVAETLGALGLVLPGLFRVAEYLTALAASGLVIVMTGATVLTAAGVGILPAIFPLVVGVLALGVARGRAPVAVRTQLATGVVRRAEL
jgi:hypothetical protein